MIAAGTAHARRSAIDRADKLCVPERGRYIRARDARHTTQARPDELIRELDLVSFFAPHHTRRFVNGCRFRGFENGQSVGLLSLSGRNSPVEMEPQPQPPIDTIALKDGVERGKGEMRETEK